MYVEIQDYIDLRLVHEVHTSERQSFRGCRRRWHWIFQEFYYPQMTAKPLEFGVAFHNAMEVLYEPTTWKWNREIVMNSAIDKFIQTCADQKKKFLESTASVDFQTEEVEEDYNERVELGVGMLKYYAKEVAPQYDKHLTPIAVEQEFLAIIEHPRTGEVLWCKCPRCIRTIDEWYQQAMDEPSRGVPDIEVQQQAANFRNQGLPVCLAGRIDCIMRDEYQRLWIVDWKTAARLARGDISGQDKDEFLELNDQIGSYVMALRRKLKIDVAGFIYVELKKSVPERPTRNKVQRLGRWFSVNQGQPTDYELYLRTVSTEDPDAYQAGLYDDHLAWLKNGGANYHARYQISKTDAELEMIEYALWCEAADMTDPNLRIYPSAGRFNCGFCAFRQPCLEKTRQGDFQYMLDTLYDRRERHYWVKESSTDSQGGE